MAMKRKYDYANPIAIKSGTETLEQTETILETVRLHEIVLFNDDVNTFDWVITSLIIIDFEKPSGTTHKQRKKHPAIDSDGSYSRWPGATTTPNASR